MGALDLFRAFLTVNILEAYAFPLVDAVGEDWTAQLYP
jgi:hypothetical protein